MELYCGYTCGTDSGPAGESASLVPSTPWSVDDPYGESKARPIPHACYDGWIYLTYTAYDESVGEEVERIEVISCRRCAEALGVGHPRTPRGAKK
jgi:hypothetical protein